MKKYIQFFTQCLARDRHPDLQLLPRQGSSGTVNVKKVMSQVKFCLFLILRVYEDKSKRELFPVTKLFMEDMILCSFNWYVAIIHFSKTLHDNLSSIYKICLSRKSVFIPLLLHRFLPGCWYLTRLRSEDSIDFFPPAHFPIRVLCLGMCESSCLFCTVKDSQPDFLVTSRFHSIVFSCFPFSMNLLLEFIALPAHHSELNSMISDKGKLGNILPTSLKVCLSSCLGTYVSIDVLSKSRK